MIDIRIPARPAAPKSKRPPQPDHQFKYAAEGHAPHKLLIIANNAGGGFKVAAKMPRF